MISQIMCLAAVIAATACEPYYDMCVDIGEQYCIAPEFLEAIIETESLGDPAAVSPSGAYKGLMQIGECWHSDRMAELEVTDLFDPYSNILVGADYLQELFETYEDPALVLMAYNMGSSKALELYNAGKISKYASKILTRSEELERSHGK